MSAVGPEEPCCRTGVTRGQSARPAEHLVWYAESFVLEDDSEGDNTSRLQAPGLARSRPALALRGRSHPRHLSERIRVLTRIQRYLRAVAPIGREHQQLGPFLATFNPHSDNPYLNYALPDDGADPSDDEVAALVEAYAWRQRRPRLEYIPGCAPAVEQRLLAGGFAIEGRLPLMVTDAGQLGAGPEPQGIELRIPTTDEELYDMAIVQTKAYDEPDMPSRDVVARRRAALADGTLAVIAVERSTGVVVGAGSCSPIRDGLTEVAAIGVSGAYRRRGIGGALASHLGREAISTGADVPWLMAAHEGERRIYERAGFRTIGEILHISR